jgi:hypothetical protein
MDENAGKGPDQHAAYRAMLSSSADAAQNEPRHAAPLPARDAILPRSIRLAMMVAAAAALGFVGSISAGGVTQFWPGVAPGSSSVAASGAQPPNAELTALSAFKTYVEGAARNAKNQFVRLADRLAPGSSSVVASGAQTANAELAALSALKTDVEGAARNANNQLARLADRLDRIERAQAEPNAKLASIAAAVDRLEKERKSGMPAAAAPAAAAARTTGAVPNSLSGSVGVKILPNWILHGVRGGRYALVENRHGDIFEITGNSALPGLGRVEGIKRQDGQWVVVTARGLITSAP